MSQNVARPPEGMSARNRFTLVAKPRPSTHFVPQQVACLEERALLSTFTLNSSARDTMHAHMHASSLALVRNVPFSTVDGQSERLDVYTPDTPAPAGGRPVIIAIHGGGWRRFDKAGYGSRVADAFVRGRLRRGRA